MIKVKRNKKNYILIGLLLIASACILFGCNGKKDEAKGMHVYCDNIKEPSILYTYYLKDGYSIQHGEYFEIIHQSNDYILVFYKHYTHGIADESIRFRLYSFSPTNAWISINYDEATSNTTVMVQGDSAEQKSPLNSPEDSIVEQE